MDRALPKSGGFDPKYGHFARETPFDLWADWAASFLSKAIGPCKDG